MENEKKTFNVPRQIIKIAEENGIKEQDILAVSQTDMNTECEYADGYVILCASKLLTIQFVSEENKVHLFKGYLNRNEGFADGFEREVQAVRCIDAADVETLKSEPQVACSLLVAKINGVDTVIGAYSNLYKRSVHSVVRLFEKLKDPKPDFGFGMGDKNEDDEYCPVCGMMYPDKNRKLCPRCMDRRSIFVRMLGFFKPYSARIAVMICCYIGMSALNLVWPYLNGKILYDKVLAGDDGFLRQLGIENGNYMTALLLIVLTMAATTLVSLLMQITQGVFTASIVTSVVRDLKKSIFSHMASLQIDFFKSRQTGSLMTRVLGDADRVTGFFIDGLPYLFIHSFSITATIVMMFTIKWQMALVAIILIPVSVVIGYKLRPMIWNAFGHRHRAERKVNSQVNDNLTGARVVKAFGQEERENTRFSRSNGRLKDAEMVIVRYQNRFKLIYDSVYQIMNILIWTLGVWFMLGKNELELGVLITFVGYVGQLMGPINFFSRVFHWWADSMNSAQRMFEIMDSVPTIREIENPKLLENPKGHIELQGVTFGYEINRPVLKDINLDIPAGTMLGIVGRSGAGKTTLVNLISRMYDPGEGRILIDGTDIKELAFSQLRRNVAMVSQETYIFMGTVRENIAYANPDASDEDVINAARLASAHEFIMRMPDGYDTIIGSSGRALSGGERQRISIARAILANPKILILDEATAAVDTETERAIQKSLQYLVKGRTTISIAHRLSTLRDADYLVVVDNGKITERGTAKELLELKGTYYKLMELQTKALALKE